MKNPTGHLPKKIFSFGFSTRSFAATVTAIMELAKAKTSAYVCVANVHMTVEAHRNAAFAPVLQNADIALLDGMPLCWSMKILHGFKPDRIAGKHLMHALLLKVTQNKMSVFFFGSSPEKLNKSEAYLTQHYPGLMIAGMVSPPFRMLSFEEKMSYAKQINVSGASLVFVALGCPKQEIWMHNMKAHIHVTMVGVGGALEVLTGQQKRPPLWIENIGMEWFFRLCLEPRRLFKRYLYTNTYFIFLLAKTLIQKKYRDARYRVSTSNK
jgi:N-acetylglucosaminyldiphosphoundecaprenol N-acetyl-beta-D-mannosaminyltransferase